MSGRRLAGPWRRRCRVRSTATAAGARYRAVAPTGRRAPGACGRSRRSWRDARGCGRVVEAKLESALVAAADLGAGCELEFPDDPEMRVSPRDDLSVAVRAGPRRAAQGADPLSAHAARSRRRPRGRPRSATARSRDMVHDLRAARRGRGSRRAGPLGRRPDLGAATARRSSTLVERHTRFVMLGAHRADQHQPRPSATRSPRRSPTLPEQLRRSLTWDQGKEMAGHAAFTVESRRARASGGVRWARPGARARRGRCATGERRPQPTKTAGQRRRWRDLPAHRPTARHP